MVKTLALIILCAACSHAAPIKVLPVPPLAAAPVFEPRHRRIVVTETSIEILETITFDGNSSRLAPTSTKIIDAVANTMLGNPSILLMQVRGHSDWEEPDRVVRAELAIQRAEAVVAELESRGVAANRLEVYGASDDEMVSFTDPAANRRIDFLIITRDSD